MKFSYLVSCRQTQWWSSSQNRSRRSQRKTSPGIERLKLSAVSVKQFIENTSLTKTKVVVPHVNMLKSEAPCCYLPPKYRRVSPLLLITSQMLKSETLAAIYLLNVEARGPKTVPHLPNVEERGPCCYLPSKC